jgi:hypothetical protein
VAIPPSDNQKGYSMYHNALPYLGSAGVAGTTAAAALPFTGGEPIWMLLAGVAMLALAGAIRRLVPKRRS